MSIRALLAVSALAIGLVGFGVRKVLRDALATDIIEKSDKRLHHHHNEAVKYELALRAMPATSDETNTRALIELFVGEVNDFTLALRHYETCGELVKLDKIPDIKILELEVDQAITNVLANPFVANLDQQDFDKQSLLLLRKALQLRVGIKLSQGKFTPNTPAAPSNEDPAAV